jgi:L-amino acid N-acyltransferase YncA
MSTTLIHELSIRAANRSDAPAVLRLFARLLATLGAQPNVELDSDMADFPAGYTGNGRFIVAVHPADGLVGMAGLRQGEIRRLFVAEAWRGRHIARQLITDLLRTGPWPDDRPLTAIVGRENHASRRVFEACGFVCTGRTPAHPQMQHCLIYECRLKLSHLCRS